MSKPALSSQIVVRLPDRMREQLDALAEESERTVAQQVRFMLRQHLNQNGANDD